MQRSLPLILILLLGGLVALWLLVPAGETPPAEPEAAAPTAESPAAEPVAAPIAGDEVAPGARRPVPQAATGLRLRALDASGQDAAPAEFFVLAGRAGRVLAAPSGTAVLESPADRVLIAARADGRWSALEALSEEESATQEELALVVEQLGGRLEVHARGSDGTPMPDFAAELVWSEAQDPGEIAGETLTRLFRDCAGEQTAVEGRAVFEGVPAGTYTVQVQYPEAAPASTTVELPSAATRKVYLDLQPGAFVTGSVVDDAGAPIAEASVYLRPGGGEGFGATDFLPEEYWLQRAPAGHRARTESDGKFRIGPAEAGSYLVGVRAENRPPFKSPSAIELRAGEEASAGTLVVPTGVDLSVRVISRQDGQPIAGARVRYAREGEREAMLGNILGWREPDPSETNAEGILVIPGLGGRSATVRAEAAGFAPAEALAELPEPVVNRQAEITLALGGELAISGQVLDARDGSPVEGARIFSRAEAEEGFLDSFVPVEALARQDAEIRTDAEGRFRVTELHPGRWKLIAKSDEFAAASDGPIELSYDRPEPKRIIRLIEGSTLRVTVLDDMGEPKPETTVSLFNFAGDDTRGERTDENGEIAFLHLTPGQYMVSAITIPMEKQIEMMSSGDNALEGFQQQMETVTIEPEQELEVTLGGLIQRAKILGYVTNRGEALAGINVMLVSGNTNKMATTEEDGYYEMEGVPEGTYLTMAGRLRMGGGSGWYETVEVHGGPEVRHDIELRATTVTARVLDGQSGEPLGSIPVILRPLEGTQGAGGYVTTSAKGEASFEFIGPGRYALSAGAAAMPFGAGGRRYSTQLVSPIVITEGSGAEEIVEVRLQQSASLSGKVFDNRGQPLKDVGVFYLDAGGQPISQICMNPTGANGTFEMGSLPPGKGNVLARHRKYGQIEQEVWLASGETTEVELVLDTGTLVHILVTDTGKKPVTGIQAALLDERGAPISQLYSGMEAMMAAMAYLEGGEQTLGPVPPGKYRVILSRPGGEKDVHEIEIKPGVPEMSLTLAYDPKD